MPIYLSTRAIHMHTRAPSMSDTGKMLLTTVMTVELFRMVISHLTPGQYYRLTWVCKGFYAYNKEIPSVQDWIRDMYRRYIMDMELSVKSEGDEEVLYYQDSSYTDQVKDDSERVLGNLYEFCTRLSKVFPGTLLCRVRIVFQDTSYNSGIGAPKITVFFCDPANPTVPDFRILYEDQPDMSIKLEKSYSSSEEFHSNYLNHMNFLYPVIEKDPIQIPADTLQIEDGRIVRLIFIPPERRIEDYEFFGA